MSDSTYTDSRLITLNASNATIVYNGSLMSSCLFSFANLLKDELDILYRQISIQNAQIPISYYIVNIYNNTLSYKIGTGVIQTTTFSRGNYNASTFTTEFKNQIPSMTLSFNKLTGVFTIINSSSFTIYSSGSTCFKLLGLDRTVSSYTGSSVLAPFPCNFAGISKIKVVSSALSTYSVDSTTGGNNNIMTVIPVNSGSYGIILYQNISSFKPMLRETSTNDFDISLLDDDDNLINFNGVSWSLSLQLDIIRKLQFVDRVFPTLSNTIPSKPAEIDESNKNNVVSSQPMQLTTGDDDLDFLLYQKGIYQ